MQKQFTIFFLFLVCSSNAQRTMFGGNNNYVAPVITVATLSATSSATSITSTSASIGGEVTSDGGAVVTSRGLLWGTSTGSSTYSSTVGSGIGTFTSSLTGLSPATRYYVRSFAINSKGTSYGAEKNFITLIQTPIASSTTTSTITSSTAILGGVLSSTGGATTAVGIQYTTNADFTGSYSSTTINSNAVAGTYTTSISSLTPQTNYIARSFATNSAGTSYGPQVSFTTPAPPITIGSTYGGGFVFYIFQPGEAGYVSGETHGLIAETRDQTTNNPNNRDYDNSNWCTWKNSSSLIADPNNHSTEGKLYSDWRLATSDELNILYTQLFSQTSLATYRSSFNGNFYWSSSSPVGNSALACTQGFAGGARYCDQNKSNVKLPVRSIRSF